MKPTTPDQRRVDGLPEKRRPESAASEAGCPTSASRSMSWCGERAQTETVKSDDTASWTWTRRTSRESSPDANERSSSDIGRAPPVVRGGTR